jgi:hypothetical protein
MTLKSTVKLCVAFGLVFSIFLAPGFPAPAWGGPLRITMTDGTSVEVPYYWESEGQIRFEIPGGVAGISKSQLSSVVEIVEAREFEPETIFHAPTQLTPDNRAMLQDIIASESGTRCELKEPNENIEILRTAVAEAEASLPGPPVEAVHGTKLTVEKNLPVICPGPNGPMVVIQDIFKSRMDLGSGDVNVVLYDSNGKVLLRKPCEVYPLNLNADAQKKLNLRGRLYLVRATIQPDSKIKRYEIAASQR